MSALVSVIIPTYNRWRFAAEAVESVLAQGYQPIEVIVSDDGSTDGTEAEMQRFQDRIRYLPNPNGGPSAARNRGLRAATGEFVAFLDADDLFAPNKIEKQMAVMARSPRVGLVYSGMHCLTLPGGERVTRRCLPGMRGDMRQKLLQQNRVATSAVLIRRSCLDQAGLFDEELRLAEDWDLWIRLSRHCEFDFVDEPLFTRRDHGGNLQKRVAAMHEHQHRVLQRAFRDDPVHGKDPILRRRCLAYIHFDACHEYLSAEEYGPALRHLLAAAAHWPFNHRYPIYLARILARRHSGGPAAPEARVGADLPPSAPSSLHTSNT